MQKKLKNAPFGGNKILLIFIVAFVSAALLFGIVFGVIAAIRQAKAAAEFSGVSVDEKTASYLASYYKYTYVASLRAADVEATDTPEFWGSLDEQGVSYGSMLVLGVRNFISDILVANYYFDRYATLDSTDKDNIEEAYQTIVSRFSEDGLDEALSAAGSDARSLKRAIEMYYKATRAKNEIYGVGGATLMGYPDECNEYLAEYSRVKLLFIRSEDTFLLDDKGERVLDGGQYVMRALTSAELAERAELISRIDSEIEGYKNGGDIQITEELFESYINSYGEGEDDKTNSGYYFSPTSDYTVAFAEDVSADIVRSALDMKIGEYRKIDVGFATCYIYKCQPASGAYVDTSEEGFFADFYSDAADFLFASILEDMRDETVFHGKLTEEDIIAVSYDSDLYVRI